jgi:MoxR-like ATPase
MKTRRSRKSDKSDKSDSSDKSDKKNPHADDWTFVEEVLASSLAHTIYLSGPPGVGKTYTAYRSGLEGREVFSISLTPETPAAELRGFWMPKGDQFVWQDGVFIAAMRKGARVVINEIAHASHDVIAILHPILESRKTAQLTLPNLETVSPAEGFQIVCTDNLPLEQLPEALRDRFNCSLHVDQPHPNSLAALSENLREAALRTFDLESERAVSIRGWLSVQAFEAEFGLQKACRAVFGHERGEQIFRAMVLGRA